MLGTEENLLDSIKTRSVLSILLNAYHMEFWLQSSLLIHQLQTEGGLEDSLSRTFVFKRSAILKNPVLVHIHINLFMPSMLDTN